MVHRTSLIVNTHMPINDAISVQVTRSSESWQFFAFIFAAVYSLTINIQDELLPKKWSSWVRISIKFCVFLVVAYLFLLNHWMRNHLAQFLGWFKVEKYPDPAFQIGVPLGKWLFFIAYCAASLLGALFAWRYFQRVYRASWYDVSGTGTLGKLDWDPDVKYLMNEDPLTHTPRFRSCAVSQRLKDLVILLFVVSLWATVGYGIWALTQAQTTEDQMRVPVFLFGFGSLAATLTGIFYQLRLRARSENRRQWINTIREVLVALIADLPLPEDSDADKDEKRKQYFPRHAKLELLLNPSEQVHRTLMALLRHAYGLNMYRSMTFHVGSWVWTGRILKLQPILHNSSRK